jgi:putative zinc finger/helix-turn-helix YgiT family protein
MKPTPVNKKLRCPLCGHFPLRPVLEDRTFDYGTEEDDRVTVHALQVPLEVCDGCGEKYSGPEAAKVEHAAICRTLGLPTPAEIIALRERLSLSQAEFADLTGIGKATLSRWERGRLLPSRGLARYLQLLARNPRNLDLLKELTAESNPSPAVPDPPVSENRVARHFTSRYGTDDETRGAGFKLRCSGYSLN